MFVILALSAALIYFLRQYLLYRNYVKHLEASLKARQSYLHEGENETRKSKYMRRLTKRLNKLILENSNLNRARTSHSEQLEATLENMGEGVVILDGSNRILMANKALRTSFNSWIGSQEITGQRLEVLFSNSGLLTIIDQIKANGSIEPAEIEFIQSNEKRWVRVSGAKAKADRPDAEDLILLVFYEITQGKEQDTIRREFVANVSHELRTPVTIIKGYADTLNKDSETMPAELRMRFLGKLQKNADRMNDLLEDLLSLAKIESAEAGAVKEPVGLNALINHVLSIYSDRFQNHGMQVALELPEEEIEVQADPSKLEQVLENLLNNATKYTPHGTALKIGTQLDNNTALIWVEDDGNGVPEEDLPRIFERFYRVEKGRSRNQGGTGLGLSIVKRIAALYRGTVEAENVKGGGLRIQISLPINDE
ncbi:hypothetical protein F7C95_19515 [Opitutia bacterium ISCC 51]|nr:hypothetical protein F7C95_19515 [Opitutae bacterium ISCC 51]QXD28143.1 hypothetical protein GA003_19420 [Opitutae bacterium ISCC 52]